MELVFLGTGAMMPTKERNTSSVFLEYKGTGLLFDCGEGTQRQMRIAGLALPKISKIFITHWHGDHVLGLPGVIQSLGASEYNNTLQVFGPRGSRQNFENMMKGTLFDHGLSVNYTEVEEGLVYEAEEYSVLCAYMKHNVPCIAFAFVEKDRRRINVEYTKKLGIPQGPLLGRLQRGESVLWKGKKVSLSSATKVVSGKKVVYVTDTLPNKNAVLLAKGADVLVCESSFAGELQEKAAEYYHMTASDAARLAKQAAVKQLVLTHFSPRYKVVGFLEKEARSVFPNCVAATELWRLSLDGQEGKRK